ncbi:hypothetical protein FG167_01360 [Lacinutrix sp. WUR7]|uniref:hypothetical protein n=1 Tax=Lacinutrix sp. WUR7 TaxID=2653681 RepID=UPI00193DD1B7|nr:hypothetical protein [Lacinutrix sp. WUR7]QRM87924.1 hypothetical protein FG167_01360 [Lacinutrix sp. WUR7]
MKHLFYLLTFILITSCGSEKTIQLPEISHTEITEVLDISPAYIFYDETKPDSLELNRKNLISTTNWLVNVDKRLTLDQVIPQITFIQNKKKNSSHKKEGVKNYYTCNDTSIKNLGFLEFTDVMYRSYTDEEAFEVDNTIFVLNIMVNSMDEIFIQSFLPETVNTNKTIIDGILSDVNTLKVSNGLDLDSSDFTVNLHFNRNLSFQEYISIKSLFRVFDTEGPTVSKNEFIY